ncbi:MAG: hypothetical protein DVB29_07340 [Verrucomicrobia bacterium]|nr:MAG: hypothetical protein DVB29_07340 [Verrucomicrobiota bacterium]
MNEQAITMALRTIDLEALEEVKTQNVLIKRDNNHAISQDLKETLHCFFCDGYSTSNLLA